MTVSEPREWIALQKTSDPPTQQHVGAVRFDGVNAQTAARNSPVSFVIIARRSVALWVADAVSKHVALAAGRTLREAKVWGDRKQNLLSGYWADTFMTYYMP